MNMICVYISIVFVFLSHSFEILPVFFGEDFGFVIPDYELNGLWIMKDPTLAPVINKRTFGERT